MFFSVCATKLCNISKFQTFMSKKFTLIFDYDVFLQQSALRFLTNQRAHDAIIFHNLTLSPPYAACRWRAPRRCRPRAQRRGATFRCKAASRLCRRPQPPHRQQSSTRRPQRGRAFSVAILNKPTCVWKKNPTGLLAGFSVVERRHSPRKNCRRAV